MPKFVSNTIQVHVAAWVEHLQQYNYLALRRASTDPLYPGLWQAITGTIEPSETAIACAFREVQEETGLTPKEIWTIPFVAVFFDPYKDEVNASPVFGVAVDFNPQISISCEHDDYKWLTLKQFIEVVELPSHKIGAQYFWDYILSKENKTMFKYKTSYLDMQ
ncbi:MAG: NUDIX domain-containing protein [Candidatus Kapaibacteriota bacterium]